MVAGPTCVSAQRASSAITARQVEAVGLPQRLLIEDCGPSSGPLSTSKHLLHSLSRDPRLQPHIPEAAQTPCSPTSHGLHPSISPLRGPSEESVS